MSLSGKVTLVDTCFTFSLSTHTCWDNDPKDNGNYTINYSNDNCNNGDASDIDNGTWTIPDEGTPTSSRLSPPPSLTPNRTHVDSIPVPGELDDLPALRVGKLLTQRDGEGLARGEADLDVHSSRRGGGLEVEERAPPTPVVEGGVVQLAS